MIGQLLLTLIAERIFESTADSRRAYREQIDGYLERRGLLKPREAEQAAGR